MRKSIFLFVLILLSYGGQCQIATPTWTPLGPHLFPINNTGQINGIGRVTKIKFDPILPGKLYATSASGGLWVSYDAGTSWRGTGTDAMPSHKEATVCIDYTDTNILYLGTGDPNYYYSGYGVWKSIDAGTTWHQSNTGMGNVLVDELLMDPTNHTHLIAVTDQGIFKSYNAGANWSHKVNTGQFTDMDFKPGAGGRVVYACTFDSLYRSDDAGETWHIVTNGFYIPGGAGGMGMRIAVTPADTNIVYLAMVANRGSILKSNDGGHSFTVVKDSFALSLTGYSSTDGGQGDYNFDFNVDPADPNTLYWVSHCNWKSTQGGIASSWQLLTNWYEIVHTDMHHITFNPHDRTMLYNANDGGVWLTADGAATWTQKSNGLDATEISPAASSQLDKNIVSIGTQDNGELYHDASWITNRGGDWYEYMTYDYSNAHTVYYANGNKRIVSGGDQSMNLPFVNDFGKMVFSTSDPNLAFVGKDTIARTFNINATNTSWDIIAVFSGYVQAMALSATDSNKLFIITNDDTLHICSNALSPSPVFTSYPLPNTTYYTAGILVVNHSPNVLYMYNTSMIYRSIDTGMTWIDVTANYPSSQDIVGMVQDKYSLDESVFIANSSDVYYKNKTMSAWQNYSHGLPTVADIQGLDVYNDGSPASRLRVPFYGRGLWEASINTMNRSVAANFGADQLYICEGGQVHFSDSSYNAPSSWSWSFPGGIPSTSSQRNPIVIYDSTGVYPVSLTVSNSLGIDSKQKTAYIFVSAAKDSLPISEGFEEAVFPPNHWINYDGGEDSVVWQKEAYGGFGNSGYSMFFDNYSHNETGKQKSMEFAADFSHYDSLILTFDVAYQTLQNYSDSLEVTISPDCGQSFHTLYIKGGNTLATAPHLDSPSAAFFPTATQWRTETISLAAYSHISGAIISFNNISGYGTYLYVDNINLHGVKSPNTGLNPIIEEDGYVSIYPNPSSGLLTLSWYDIERDHMNLYVYDMLGSKVKEIYVPINNTNGKQALDISDIANGIYTMKLASDRINIVKLSIQK